MIEIAVHNRCRSRKKGSFMKAVEVTASDLFQADTQLVVPLWQRPYSWDRPQWRELWEDIQRVARGEVANHFLGSVVVKARPWSGLPREARRFWIVDGQQRAITLTVMVAAIRDRLARLASTEEERAQVIDDYTGNLLHNTQMAGEYRERLVPQARDGGQLGPIVSGNTLRSAESRIDRAYRFFSDRLDNMSSDEVELLIPLLMTKLTAVWVTLQDTDNAHRVFQTLNAGGLPLRQPDLVRNYFFLLLGDRGDQFYADHWKLMENDLGARDLEDYFVAWSVSQGYNGSKEQLFTYFQKDLGSREHDVDQVAEYGRRLTATARLFRWIRRPEDSRTGMAQSSLADLRDWKTTPVEGLLLLVLRRHESGSLSEKHLRHCFEYILSFMARRQLAGYEPNLHKSIFTRIALRLKAHPDLYDQDLADFLRYVLSSGSELSAWPTDELVRSTVSGVQAYSTSRSRWVFKILERINRGQFEMGKHAPPTLDRVRYSIEHVMPQKLTPRWEADLESWGVEKPSRLTQSHLHVLGNLSLTPINPELSNLPFEEKRIKLGDDWLRLNTDIAQARTWTEARINERSIALAAVACSVFPGPMNEKELHASVSRYTVSSDESARASASAQEEEDNGANDEEE